jgi:Fis family transcriptional regulator
MAHRKQLSANRFAQNSDLSADAVNYPQNNYKDSPLGEQLDNDGSMTTSQTQVSTAYSRHNPHSAQAPLRVHVERVVREYFATLGDEIPTGLYERILKEVELPLLTVVLEQTRGNQSKCAQILGLNRGTLRKKLKTYDLMS